MKKLFFVIYTILFFILLSQSTNAQTRQADSLALVSFYNSCCNTNCLVYWDLTDPMDTWSRVTMKNGRVSELTCHTDGLSGTMVDLNLTKLEKLNLYGNDLSGFIPDFSGLTNLEVLDLGSNDLYGTIPNFSGLTNLKELDVFNNQLAGAIPNFSNLPNLEELYLNSNQFSSTVPDFSNLPTLIKVWLSYNNLSGTIPNFSNLPVLQELFLSGNNLNDTIPNFSSLPNLRILGLKSNQLTGPIPNFSNLPILDQLTLTSNQLNGNIPTFSNLYSLRYFMVSHNRLSGEVPDLVNLLSNQLLLVELEGNQFTFEDFMPNFSSICNEVGSWYFDYQDQDSIGAIISATPGLGSNYVIDLVVDDAVSANVYYWSKDGVVIDTIYGVNEYTITNFSGSDAGVYTAEIINTTVENTSCNSLSLYSRPVTLQASNSTTKIQAVPLQVSPNPVQDMLYIQTQAMASDYQVEIINLHGQVIESLSGNNNKLFMLPMAKYPAGVYIVRLQQRGKIWQEKVIKR